MKSLKDIQTLLACPVCKSKLNLQDQSLRCANDSCAKEFPVCESKPVLINESNSLFAIFAGRSKLKNYL